MEWTDQIIGQLRALWAEGLSTAEIGRRMGVSKNAVVGKAHRLSLPPRPSPIRRDGPALRRTAALPRAVGSTLPPLTPASQPVPAPVAAMAARPAESPVPVAARAPMAQDPVRPAPVPEVERRPAPPLRAVSAPRGASGRITTCCWPIGEPGTPAFRFCDAEAAPSKPYCAEHAQLAYVKVRDRREDAA